MLGLADEVGRHVGGVGGVVGEDHDLGGAGLGVDADDALQRALGCRHVDVARAGDEVDGGAAATVRQVDAEGEHGDRLRAADRVHLVDPEQEARGEDRRVRPAVEVALRRRHDGERRHARHLRGHDVHDDAARVDRPAAGHVQAHPVDGQPPLGDRAAGHDGRRDVGAALVHVHAACPVDRLEQRGPDGRLERVGGGLEPLDGNAERRRPDAVEPLGPAQHRSRALGAHVVDDGPDPLPRVGHVHRRARHDGTRVGVRTAEVDASDHVTTLRCARARTVAAVPAQHPSGAWPGAAAAHLRAPLPRDGRGAAGTPRRGRSRVRHRGGPRRPGRVRGRDRRPLSRRHGDGPAPGRAAR